MSTCCCFQPSSHYAYNAPKIAPNKSASGKCNQIGKKSIEKPIITAAIPPIIICPSAPMLNSPALNANAIPKAAKIRGVAAVKVSEIAFNEPNDSIKDW